MVGVSASISSASFPVPGGGNLRAGHEHSADDCGSCRKYSEKISPARPGFPGELTPEEQKQVEELENRDREVRAHEQAHLAAAGGYARGGPSFTYQRGPDGKTYAVGGEVPIDLSPVANDPQATLRKAETIQRAALAPAEPSGPDRQVAAQAVALAAKARQELADRSQETGSKNPKPTPASPASPSNSSNGTGDTESPDPVTVPITVQSTPAPIAYAWQKYPDAMASTGSRLDLFV